MARAALQIGVRDLAASSGVSSMTISRFENGHSGGHAETLRKLQSAFEASGIEFIPENGGGAGVRLRKSSSPYDYFPFPIFETDLPFGKGRFGVLRTNHDYNRWSQLALVQLSNPNREFPDVFELWPFWVETLNGSNKLEEILTQALASIEGPRKPDHPSKLRWAIIQPNDVYPGAREFIGDLAIDWQQRPPQILPNKSQSTLTGIYPEALRSSLRKPLAGLQWWRLDEL